MFVFLESQKLVLVNICLVFCSSHFYLGLNYVILVFPLDMESCFNYIMTIYSDLVEKYELKSL